ncbi:hypothetical protein NLI96_g3209 [Meripilus lineatus]|uniref:Uncharacterized protein n=1 Tax=Meripilus lineatus TaxID=2056292 RepID=A0AAD5V7E6_9APHY|nr:hypothetical protein NLI96_g3209 [Physisporinus lineatus]
MAPAPAPGEPRESPKPQPLGNGPFITLFTICTLCAIFILWRRASAIRAVVGHQLKSWAGRREGAIRLSLDDGPAAHEFLQDDYDEDNADIADDEPLAMRAQQLKSIERRDEGETRRSIELVLPNTPPPPPPKT